MDAQEIMQKAEKLYNDIGSMYSISAARHAALMAAYLLYQLAKLHVPDDEAKKLKQLNAPKPPKRTKDDIQFDE